MLPIPKVILKNSYHSILRNLPFTMLKNIIGLFLVPIILYI